VNTVSIFDAKTPTAANRVRMQHDRPFTYRARHHFRNGMSLAPIKSKRPVSRSSFVKKRLELLSFVATVAVVFALGSWVLTSWNADSLGTVAQAQQTTPNSQQTPAEPPPSQNQAPPQTQPPAGQPGQGSDQTQQAAPADGHEFVGTIVKQGDKYMFQDAASGQTYDIDHQDEVKRFDGKKVRVRGTLDPQTKTIHVQ
jgi:hypothetical protein